MSSAKGAGRRRGKARRKPRPQCKGTTKAGRRCTNRAKAGTEFCGAHSGKAGPPTKLTEQRRDRIVLLAAAGNFRTKIAAAVGIHVDSLYHWLERGEADDQAGIDNEFSELFRALTRAEAEAETDAVNALRKGMVDDWHAAVAYLERRNPDDWAKRREVTGKKGGPIKHERVRDLSNLTVREREQLLELEDKMTSS